MNEKRACFQVTRLIFNKVAHWLQPHYLRVFVTRFRELTQITKKFGYFFEHAARFFLRYNLKKMHIFTHELKRDAFQMKRTLRGITQSLLTCANAFEFSEEEKVYLGPELSDEQVDNLARFATTTLESIRERVNLYFNDVYLFLLTNPKFENTRVNWEKNSPTMLESIVDAQIKVDGIFAQLEMEKAKGKRQWLNFARAYIFEEQLSNGAYMNAAVLRQSLPSVASSKSSFPYMLVEEDVNKEHKEAITALVSESQELVNFLQTVEREFREVRGA